MKKSNSINTIEPEYISPNNKWFDIPTVKHPYSCEKNTNTCEFLFSEKFTELEQKIITSEITLPYHEKGTLWSLKRNLYEKILKISALDSSSNEASNFVSNEQFGEVGQLSEMALQINGLFENSVDLVNQMTDLNVSQKQISNNIRQIDILIKPDMIMPEIQGLLSIKTNLLSQYTTTVENNNSLWDTHWNEFLHELELLNFQNESIVTNSIQAENEKKWNSIYLSKICRNELELSNEEIEVLKKIANQCPLDGGSIVFSARSILSLVQGINTDYADNCEEGFKGNSTEERNNKNEDLPNFMFKVYPNPATDFIQIELINAINDKSELILIDIFGKVIQKVSLLSTKSSLKMDISSLPKGVYFLSLSESGKNIFTNKIIKL
jgi:hypothetical protein